MIAKIIEILTGKDDLERIAYKEDINLLNKYLKTRKLYFPKRPQRFLDPETFTQQELLDLIEQEAKELDGEQIELWILEVDGKNRLPAFSSEKKMQEFVKETSQKLNKLFSLGCIQALLSEVSEHCEVDFVDLNPCSRKSWEIGVRRNQ